MTYRRIRERKTKEGVSTNKNKVKGLGSPQEGRAFWSLLASSEIFLPTAKALKTTADKFKSPKAACTVNSKPCI